MAKNSATKKAQKKANKQLKQVVKLTAKNLKKQMKTTTGGDPKLTREQMSALAQSWSQALARALDDNRLNDNIVPLYPGDPVVLDKPLKAKPCKSCPALKNGLCRCAVKRAQKTRIDDEIAILVNA